jgi:hypothetical protein
MSEEVWTFTTTCHGHRKGKGRRGRKGKEEGRESRRDREG